MTRSDLAASSAGVLVADDPVRVGEVKRRPVTGRALSVSTGDGAWRLPGAAPAGGPGLLSGCRSPRAACAGLRRPSRTRRPGCTTSRSRGQPQGLTRVRCRGLQAHNRRMFVELDTRHDARYTVSLEWDHDSDETQIVVADNGTSSMLVFPVPRESAGEAFRHPFRHAP